MKIKMKQLAAGPFGVLQADQVYDLPDEQARPLVAGGYALDLTPVVSTPNVAYIPAEPVLRVFPETADLPEVEQAVKPRRGKKAA